MDFIALALFVKTSFAQNIMMAERKGSIIKGDNDSWTCKMCEKEYMDKKSEFMKCEILLPEAEKIANLVC